MRDARCSSLENCCLITFLPGFELCARQDPILHLDLSSACSSLLACSEADILTEIFSPEILLNNKSSLQHWIGNLNENLIEKKTQTEISPLFCMKYFFWSLKKHLSPKRAVTAEKQSTEVSANNLTRWSLC